MRGLVAGALVLGAASAWAAPHDLVVQKAGAGGTTEAAAPFVEQLLRYLEGKLGWPANSASGQFFPDATSAEKFVEEKKPGFGLVDAPVFLDWKKKLGADVVGSVYGDNQSLGHFSVVVKDAKYKSLDDLKGKTLASNHLEFPKFVSRIGFDGKLDVEKHFVLSPKNRGTKAVSALGSGAADAILVDDAQLAALKGDTGSLGFKPIVVFTSPPLPPTPVVMFEKNIQPKDREAISKALLGMCGDSPKGSDVCKALKITKISPPDKTAWDNAVRKYEK
jgi:ABC-type amino acid transport substrate-binding protein